MKKHMEMAKACYSSNLDNYGTPQWLFDELNEKFGFTLDPCCTKETAKCEKYYTKEENGLTKDWAGEVVYINPPYGREIPKWIKKAYESFENDGTVCVLLLPARTDVKWFHEYAVRGHVQFIRGRLRYEGAEGGVSNDAPFPSIIVIYHEKYYPNIFQYVQPKHRVTCGNK